MCERLKFADSFGDCVHVVVFEVVLDDHSKQRAPEEFGSEDGVFGLLGAVAGKDEVALRFDGCFVCWVVCFDWELGTIGSRRRGLVGMRCRGTVVVSDVWGNVETGVDGLGSVRD